MKSKKHTTTPSSYLFYFIGIIFIFALLLGIILLNQFKNSSIKNPHNTTTAKISHISPNLNKKGFHGYSLNNTWFDLDLPKECSTNYSIEKKTITCKTSDFTVFLYPQDGGREVNVVEK